MAQAERPLVTAWCMRIACWISKATYTHAHAIALGMCNTYCFSTATMVARTPLNVTFIRILRVFVITANARLPLLTVPAHFISLSR